MANNRMQLWAGRFLSFVPALFLILNGMMTLAKPAPVVEGTLKLGYPESVITGLGLAALTSTILYLIPATSVLGAILLTAYFGGAVATHVRVGDPWFATLLPVLFSAAFWGGLWLRSPLLRSLIPLVRRTN